MTATVSPGRNLKGQPAQQTGWGTGHVAELHRPSNVIPVWASAGSSTASGLSVITGLESMTSKNPDGRWRGASCPIGDEAGEHPHGTSEQARGRWRGEETCPG